ncbi:MAG: DsbA family oxidoreductase [Vicinamibacterales bacterium]
MKVEIWSDIVCPWCYIGKRRFERALAAFPHREEVTVEHRSFQLNPAAERGVIGSRTEMLKGKYRLSDDQIATMDERMERLAAEEGLAYNLEATVTGNTLDAHRLVHVARASGLAEAMVERLYRAYFTEGRSVFDEDSLVALAVEVGLEADLVRATLRSNTYVDAVTLDTRQAAALGASGVPFFVIDGQFGVSGAQAVDVFEDALAKAWESQAARRPAGRAPAPPA